MRTVSLASNAGVSVETIVRWCDDDWILRRDIGVNENDSETLQRFNKSYLTFMLKVFFSVGASPAFYFTIGGIIKFTGGYPEFRSCYLISADCCTKRQNWFSSDRLQQSKSRRAD